MNLNINRKKAKVYAVLVSFIIVLGVFAVGMYKATKWTNDHTVVWRSPIQTPWVISKKGFEASKEQELAEQITEAKEQLEKLQSWASTVDRELPNDLKASPQGR